MRQPLIKEAPFLKGLNKFMCRSWSW